MKAYDSSASYDNWAIAGTYVIGLAIHITDISRAMVIIRLYGFLRDGPGGIRTRGLCVANATIYP
jgi:hypothetical protein